MTTLAWLKERATERNTKRAAGVMAAVGGYFGFIDPDALTQAGTVVAILSAIWLAVDAFLTPEGAEKRKDFSK
jgi:hypothetical protein